MTETSTPDDRTGTDPLRQHPQDPAEGPDPDATAQEQQPREHPEGPAEG